MPTKNPDCWRIRGQLLSTNARLLHYLAGFEATGADSNLGRLAVNSGVNGLQIDVESPQTQIMGVADRVAHARLFPAYFAYLRHHLLQIKTPI